MIYSPDSLRGKCKNPISSEFSLPIGLGNMINRSAVLLFRSVGGVFLLAHDAAGTNITLFIVIHAQFINTRAFVRRSMGELAVSDIDADMRYAIAAASIKKHQVARAKIAFANLLANFELGRRRARQINVEFVEYVLREARTVEATRCRSAIHVRNT